MATYTRLTALDRFFLDIEDRSTHMHVGATCIFEEGPLRDRHGGIDSDLIREYIASRLHLLPRYRQRLARTPLEKHPVWVDDDDFNIRYHVRHACLPRPGDERQLKRFVAWVNSQQLDRGKPLWEMWVVEGLDGGRFALVNKTHHCMIDGVSGADLLAVLLTLDDRQLKPEPPRWLPQPKPSRTVLLRDAAWRRLTAPITLASEAVGNLWSDPIGTVRQFAEGASALGETVLATSKKALETPFNKIIGAHRRFDWLEFDLGEVKAVKERLGGTVNDVVLAAVAGATGRFLERRGIPSHRLAEHPFRAFCPVNIRAVGERGKMGNRVSNMIAELPITESDPGTRLSRICQVMADLKESQQVRGTELFEQLSEWTTPALLTMVGRLMRTAHPYNIVVTNVPGPQFPLYLLGARMQQTFPLVPLFSDQGVGIALFSYNGRIGWGFNADRDLMPDLHDFVEAVRLSFDELKRAAGLDKLNGAGRSQDHDDAEDGEDVDSEPAAQQRLS